MITINLHNKTNIPTDQVFAAIAASVNNDKIIKDRNMRLHNGRMADGIISITACAPRQNDIVLECDITEVNQFVKTLKALEKITETEEVNNNENYVVNTKGEVVE